MNNKVSIGRLFPKVQGDNHGGEGRALRTLATQIAGGNKAVTLDQVDGFLATTKEGSYERVQANKLHDEVAAAMRRNPANDRLVALSATIQEKAGDAVESVGRHIA